jgi:hypothetical protein
MADEHLTIEAGSEVFLSETGKPFGAVREVRPHGRSEIIVYIENAGDVAIPLEAVTAAHFQKVIVDGEKLDSGVRDSIRRAHRAEDRSI